jgi:hypothetical protein
VLTSFLHDAASPPGAVSSRLNEGGDGLARGAKVTTGLRGGLVCRLWGDGWLYRIGSRFSWQSA